jgi:hypothetical protein
MVAPVVRQAATGIGFGIIDFSKYFGESGPVILYGSAKGSQKATWYKVSFSQRFSAQPTVTATAFYRPGTQPKKVYTAPTWTPPSFTAPTVSAPVLSITIPALSISLPTWDKASDWRTDLRAKVRAVYKKLMSRGGLAIHDMLNDKGPSWWVSIFNGPGNAIQGALYGPPGTDFNTHNNITFDAAGNPIQPPADGSAYSRTTGAMDELGNAIAGGLETIVNTIIPNDITRFRDNTQSSINSTLTTFKNNTQNNINSALATYKTNIDKMMGDYTAQLKSQMTAFSQSVQSAVNQNAKLAENAVNSAIDILYEHVGLPQEATITVVQLRNVSVDGFEFLSQGDTEIHWIALA